MKNIYDIYLNFNKDIYDFYDWNKDDNILHIKKIPIIKINKNKYIKIITNNFETNNELYTKIKNKTEYLNKDMSKNTCALFTDSENIIAIMFDNNGFSIKRSCLYIDEELEVLDEIYSINETEISFTKNKKVKNILKTRKQYNIEKFIYKELENIKTDKLNYIFFECFGKHENNKEKILNNIKKLDFTSETTKKIYDILKLTSTNKNKMI